jgi:alcohol dehydrogenase class IV
MNFEFATAQRIIFGPGTLKQLPEFLTASHKRPALITGTNAQRIMPVLSLLKNANTRPAAFSISGEPTTDRIQLLADEARKQGCDCVIAFGGGSVIDAGKAIAALLTNTKELHCYLEVIGKGEPLENEPAFCIAIPTTAGTGAEVTRNAVLKSEEHQLKVSMRHPAMLPNVALIDPELTLEMPRHITASTGLDAFTQLLEAFTSSKSNPLTDGICREGLARAAHALPRLFAHGSNLSLREDMAIASLFSGLALANAGLGVVHGFAGPIGGLFEAPHGLVCASLLPAAVRTNIQALEERAAEHTSLKKYQEMARIVTGSNNADLSAGLQWIEELCLQLQVPGLESCGITLAHIPELVEKGKQASSMKGNPIPLTNEELTHLLQNALTAPLKRHEARN